QSYQHRQRRAPDARAGDAHDVVEEGFKVKRCACATPAATPTPRVRNACASALRMRAAGRLSGRPAATRKRCACATRDCRVGPARGSPNGRALPWHTERGLPLCRPRVAHTGPDLVPEAVLLIFLATRTLQPSCSSPPRAQADGRTRQTPRLGTAEATRCGRRREGGRKEQQQDGKKTRAGRLGPQGRRAAARPRGRGEPRRPSRGLSLGRGRRLPFVAADTTCATSCRGSGP
ncbi:unnamed protein product, partial [Prorocentrum cordatum]